MNPSIIHLILILLFSAQFVVAQGSKPRVVILADMGNEPDEEQQMVHMMMYANEFDLEGLIAVTGKFLNPDSNDPYKQVLHPELFLQIIDAYEKVYENLTVHAQGWPQPNYLRSIVVTGQTGYGIDAVGKGKSSPGSELILNALLKQDNRPLYVVVNAGSNTLAQALVDFEASHDQQEMATVLKKIRVFENGAQDNAGAWICAKYPEIHWIRSNYQTYCYGGPSWDSEAGRIDEGVNLGPHTWKPYEYSGTGQHQWALKHIKGNHGALGQRWPLRQMRKGKLVYLEGGGTIPWLGLIHQGLSDMNHPHWGGWSGRFTQEKVTQVYSKHQSVRVDEEKYGEFACFSEASDRWIDTESDLKDWGPVYQNIYAPVWRWRRAFFNDFQARMDWCIVPYEEANHNPIAAINGESKEKIHFLKAKAGETISLDASASTDPDGDPLKYKWWIYPEAGNYQREVDLADVHSDKLALKVPDDASGKEIHLILEIMDENEIVSLYDYRRIVVQIN